MTNAELADEIERLNRTWRDDAIRTIECSVAEWRQIIAALRRSEPVLGECEECGHTIVTPLKRLPERQLSSDKVLVPREPTEAILKAGESCYLAHQQDFATNFWLRSLIEKLYSRLLAAAAEGHHE